jgi:2-oxoglutarate/2-oxoacid ferredoxin oxidoreductase subunit alpha
MNTIKDDVSLVLCGAAGKGILTIIKVLTNLLKQEGYHVYATNEYMSRIRGGSNAAQIRVGSKRVQAVRDKMDILIPFDRAALDHVRARITQETIVLGDKTELRAEPSMNKRMVDVPFAKITGELGNPIYANTVAIGVILALFNVKLALLEGVIRKQLASKGEELIKKNIEAGKQGYAIGKELARSVQIKVKKNPAVIQELFINGTEACALGAIAGGCNFISAYPMSPSTGFLTFLAKHQKKFGILVEQAEDELCAANMVLGAWYAGARAVASTSGGGFALMSEAISLGGMIETPMVLYLAMRPGPATGLPTRTEQGDLELALYSGHGEFPRILLAPGTTEEAFYLTQKAFNLADYYQVPVFILVDQYFVDAHHNIPVLDVSKTKIQHHIIKTTKDYKRFTLTKNGVSPRGIPGHGEGLVCVDSDEHDEEGRITESMSVRNSMVEKRAAKLELMKEDTVAPNLLGTKNYEYLVIGWGSTFPAIKEALEIIHDKRISFLHFSQVYPFPRRIEHYFEKAKTTILIENNATAQFGKLIRRKMSYDVHHKILKYDGLAFTVEELVEKIKSVIS